VVAQDSADRCMRHGQQNCAVYVDTVRAWHGPASDRCVIRQSPQMTCKMTCTAAAGQDCGRFFPPGLFDDGRPGRGRGGAWPAGWPALSGKFAVLAAMLERLRPTGERIVIVSNYTQTLDLFMQLCRDRGVRAPRAPAARARPHTVSASGLMRRSSSDGVHTCRAA